jgi:CBS domain-containing protein
MRIEQRMTRNAACCAASDSLATAATLLWQNDCGSVPVVDANGRVQGMITDRDICMAAWSTGRSLMELRVGNTMTRDVASIGVMDSLLEAEMIMRSRGVHRLPVMDAQQRVIGILCSNDLLRWIDDGGAHGSMPNAAEHLVRTLAIIGRPRSAVGEAPVLGPAGDGRPPAVPLPARRHPDVEPERQAANRRDGASRPERFS